MKFISDYIGCKLLFKRIYLLKRIYQLKYNEVILCELNFRNIFINSAQVSGLTKEDIEFYKTSIFKREISIRYVNYELPFASYKSNFPKLSGTVYLPKGEQLIIKYDLFNVNYEIRTLSEVTLVKMKSNFFFTKTYVEIINKSDLLDKYPWVIALTFYIIKRKRSQ